MKITKLGHCSMLIEVDSLKIITDPGKWSELKTEDLANINIILVTHEHGDHLHAESLKLILDLNPSATVITNASVGTILKDWNYSFERLEGGESNTFSGITLEGFGTEHAEIYNEFGLVQNTGYFINNKFFYPGDAFTNPKKQVEVLALPVVGPWLKIKEAVDYAKELSPKIAFPVHDGMLKHFGPFHGAPQELLEGTGVNFIVPEVDRLEIEF